MIGAILTDIEGTTSSIDFVKQTLFPYARKRLPAFVVTHADKAEVQHWLHEAAREAQLISASQTEIIELLQRWIDEDRKATSLKALQGMIWEEGYRSGEFRAHMYSDAVLRLQEWHRAGIALYVYSSGSVPAQKLFFEFSDAGNLAPLFSGWFDTEIGAKRDAGSYRSIAGSIGIPASDILFLTDIGAEADAAAAAGMRTTVVSRSPDACTREKRHVCVEDFSAIQIT